MTIALRRLLPAAAALSLVVGACSSAAASPVPPPPTPGTSASGPAAPSATPIESGGGDTSPGEPGASGDPGGGAEMPIDNLPGRPQLVVPHPGQQLVHPVAIGELVGRVDGRHVVLNARWWSGVEPCSILDSVDVARDGSTFRITLNEGTSDPDAMCIAIALEKVTVIDLGELEPGTYTVKPSLGDAPPIEVVVS